MQGVDRRMRTCALSRSRVRQSTGAVTLNGGLTRGRRCKTDLVFFALEPYSEFGVFEKVVGF